MEARVKLLQVSAWSLGGLVMLIAFLGWWQDLSGSVTIYELFPLFGLVAFSLMWSMYIVIALRMLLGVSGKAVAAYFTTAGWLILAAILLHPGLLEWQLWRDGFGFPPESVLNNYVAPSLAGAAIVGMICFVIFLAFEARRIFQKYRWWRFMQYLADFAVVAILYHSLSLGSNLQNGWLRSVWYFYGITLVIALCFMYIRRFKQPSDQQKGNI